MTLVLFDIDGTLTRGGGAGARALARSIEEAYGWPDPCGGLRFQGGTDRGLVRTVLDGRTALCADPASAADQIDRILSRYVEILPEEISRSPYFPLPGAAEILAALGAEGVGVGLVTGNHPRAAELKLGSAGLPRAFEFGAFGSESEDRSALVRLATERAASKRPSPPSRVFVVGDTENDVRAAHRAGARAIAVVTGGASRETLEAEAPHAVFADLLEARRAAFWR